tara:strand:- start:104 stop:919 length:816 start_codon:yes stop_codon:yes gene_type:complete
MKFLRKSFALAGIVALSVTPSVLASPTVSVPDFKNNADNIPWWSNRMGKQLSDVLSNELSNVGLNVVERGNVDAVLSEQELADLGIVSKTARNNNNAKRGQMRGAQFIILGGVNSYEEGVKQNASNKNKSIMGISEGGGSVESSAYIAVDLRVVNSTTGEIVASRTVEGTAKSTSKKAASSFDGSAIGNLIGSRSNSKQAQMFGALLGSAKSESSSVEVNKVPKEKAIRAALISASDYVNCVLVVRGSCLAEFDAQERKRRSKTLGVLSFD